MPTYMGEEEVIKKNMALAQEQIYNVEYMEALPEDEIGRASCRERV